MDKLIIWLARKRAFSQVADMPTTNLRQLVEQRLGVFKIGHGESLGKPAVDAREQIAGFVPATLFAP